jgi:hypothetical protein
MAGLRDDQGNPIVLKNAAGQTILSMSKPVVNAVAPTGIELLGDAKRLLTGYNTLSYDPNAVGIPSTTGGTIVKNEGILSNINPTSFIPGFGIVQKIIEGAKGVYDFINPKPPVVTYGGSSDITVTEEPSGVINALPDTSSIKVEDLPSITDTTVSQFDPLGNPALYGDGTFFDKFDEQLEALGIEQDPLYS